MHNTNRIGILAEKIIAIRICIDGTITPFVRERGSRGRMADASAQAGRRTKLSEAMEFVARVRSGDSGVVELGPGVWRGFYFVGVIPLGANCPFGSDDSPSDSRVRTSSDSALERIEPDQVWFRFADGKLTWKSENVSGEAVVNETYPEVEVSLRLPPGNEGELRFASPLFTNAAGESASVLAVA